MLSLLIHLIKAAKNTYVQRATTTIVSTLEVIAPSDPTALWQFVQTTRSVNKALGLNALPAEQKYLKALPESYHQAETWDAKRQILAVMADLTSLKQMQMLSLCSQNISSRSQDCISYYMGAVLQYQETGVQGRE